MEMNVIYVDWWNLTQREERFCSTNPTRGKGLFHEQEVKLYEMFKKRRSKGIYGF